PEWSRSRRRPPPPATAAPTARPPGSSPAPPRAPAAARLAVSQDHRGRAPHAPEAAAREPGAGLEARAGVGPERLRAVHPRAAAHHDALAGQGVLRVVGRTVGVEIRIVVIGAPLPDVAGQIEHSIRRR